MKSLYFYWSCIIIFALSFLFKIYATETNPVLNPDTLVPLSTDMVIVDTPHLDLSIVPKAEAQVIPNTKTNDNNTTMAPVIKPVTPDINDSNIQPVLSPRITQGEDQHVQKGQGSMYAIDVIYPDGNATFPKKHGDYLVHHIGYDERIGDYIIIRHGLERWVFGHTVTSRKTGEYIANASKEVLGQSNRSGISQATHTHIERWKCPNINSRMKDCFNVAGDDRVAERNQAIIEQRGWGENKEDSIREKSKRVVSKEVDLDKLAHAVARAETGGCKKGSAISKNNCFGIMEYSNGTRRLKVYKNHEESFKDFKRIWSSYYGGFPTIAMAKKWTGNENKENWLRIVKSEYNRLQLEG